MNPVSWTASLARDFDIIERERSMGNIEYKDEGKHGTITNGAGQTLTGKIVYVGMKDFDFKIDNNSTWNSFRKDEWTFVPDKQLIPTKDLAVIKIKEWNQNSIFVRTQRGWDSRFGISKYSSTEIQQFADKYGFEVLFEGIV